MTTADDLRREAEDLSKMALAAVGLDDKGMLYMLRIRQTMCECAAAIVDHLERGPEGREGQ